MLESLGKMLRFHRKKSGLSQAELALLAGVGKTVVFDIEKGKISIQLDTLVKILKVLNIKIELLSPLMNLFKESLMKKARVFVNDILAGELREITPGSHYQFVYEEEYKGLPVSLTMPIVQKIYDFDRFPPFFDGVLPEGFMLEAFLKTTKIDRYDYMSQLIALGGDLVGNVTVKAMEKIKPRL